MITAKTLLKQLTGKDIYESLIHFMTEEFADFAAIRKRYEHAMDILRTKLGGKIVTDTMEESGSRLSPTFYSADVWVSRPIWIII